MSNLLGLCLVLVGVFLGTVYGTCPNGWHQFQNSCFLLKHNKLNWDAAQKQCHSMKARLAEVQTKAKVDYLRNLLSKLTGDWWIGGKDDVVEGHWQWASGELFDYTDWYPHEPNNDNNQDCLQMYKKDQYHWDDDRCVVPKYYICEMMEDGSSLVVG